MTPTPVPMRMAAARSPTSDLHDGAQQRLVSVGLKLRTVEACVPPELQPLKEQISDLVTTVAGVSNDLQELSRGIHPAILSKGKPQSVDTRQRNRRSVSRRSAAQCRSRVTPEPGRHCTSTSRSKSGDAQTQRPSRRSPRAPGRTAHKRYARRESLRGGCMGARSRARNVGVEVADGRIRSAINPM
jgi:Histidine kinase